MLVSVPCVVPGCGGGGGGGGLGGGDADGGGGGGDDGGGGSMVLLCDGASGCAVGKGATGVCCKAGAASRSGHASYSSHTCSDGALSGVAASLNH